MLTFLKFTKYYPQKFVFFKYSSLFILKPYFTI